MCERERVFLPRRLGFFPFERDRERDRCRARRLFFFPCDRDHDRDRDRRLPRYRDERSFEWRRDDCRSLCSDEPDSSSDDMMFGLHPIIKRLPNLGWAGRGGAGRRPWPGPVGDGSFLS